VSELGEFLVDAGSMSLVEYAGDAVDVVVPAGVRSVGDRAFAGAPLSSVVLPDGLVSVGASAFSDCSGLTSVSLPDGLLEVGDYAFDFCDGLHSLRLPASVRSLGVCSLPRGLGLLEAASLFARGDSAWRLMVADALDVYAGVFLDRVSRELDRFVEDVCLEHCGDPERAKGEALSLELCFRGPAVLPVDPSVEMVSAVDWLVGSCLSPLSGVSGACVFGVDRSSAPVVRLGHIELGGCVFDASLGASGSGLVLDRVALSALAWAVVHRERGSGDVGVVAPRDCMDEALPVFEEAFGRLSDAQERLLFSRLACR
jgi:hypothetical protein